MDKNPFDMPCPVYGCEIDLGLCSDTMDVVDDFVRETLIATDLRENGLEEKLTDQQIHACKHCPRRTLI